MSASAFADIQDLLMLGPDGDETAVAAVRARDAQLTKPAGSLGELERLVEFLARWQGKPEPTMEDPMVAIFAANHGVTDQGISAYPREVTQQMVANFTNGGAAISQICALHEINLRVFELALEVPTGDITIVSAMDERATAATIAYGMEAIAGEVDLLCIGEMGIGNTTVAAAIYAALYGGTGADWVGRGTGVDDEGLKRKADAVDRALQRHAGRLNTPFEILSHLGGREIAAMLGAIISARHQKVPVIIDGFVATSAAAIAHAVNPAAIDHCLSPTLPPKTATQGLSRRWANGSARSGHAAGRRDGRGPWRHTVQDCAAPPQEHGNVRRSCGGGENRVGLSTLYFPVIARLVRVIQRTSLWITRINRVTTVERAAWWKNANRKDAYVHPLHSQQELFVLVPAPLGSAQGARHCVRGAVRAVP